MGVCDGDLYRTIDKIYKVSTWLGISIEILNFLICMAGFFYIFVTNNKIKKPAYIKVIAGMLCLAECCPSALESFDYA